MCKVFHGFYILREHKRNDHGAQRGSSAQKFDFTQLMGDVYDKRPKDNSPKEEREMCTQFLVGDGMENGRHRVHKFVMNTLDPKYLLEKLDFVFDSLKCAT